MLLRLAISSLLMFEPGSLRLIAAVPVSCLMLYLGRPTTSWSIFMCSCSSASRITFLSAAAAFPGLYTQL